MLVASYALCNQRWCCLFLLRFTGKYAQNSSNNVVARPNAHCHSQCDRPHEDESNNQVTHFKPPSSSMPCTCIRMLGPFVVTTANYRCSLTTFSFLHSKLFSKWPFRRMDRNSLGTDWAGLPENVLHNPNQSRSKSVRASVASAD